MKLISPTRIALPSDDEKVKKFLSYTDKSVDYQIKKLRDNVRWRGGDPDSFAEKLESLKEERIKSLLFYDAAGTPMTYSGLWSTLQKHFSWDYNSPSDWFPEADLIPWHKKPFEMRPYQKEALEALVKVGHGAIELPTGSGKSLIIMNLLKYYGLKAVIVTPRKQITTQLYKDIQSAFGKKYVGQYGGGAKSFNKQFTVTTAQSLVRLEEGSEQYEAFAGADVVIFDESHTTPAATFQKICNGVLSDAKLRFFISATQRSNNGTELLLEGITGPVVYRRSFRELADLGYLKHVKVNIVEAPMFGTPKSDPMKQTREHLYNNPYVLKKTAEIANKAYNMSDRSVLILVEQIDQLNKLINHMNVPFEVIHGQKNDDRLPTVFRNPDTEEILRRFNAGDTRVLIGTSCISMGVDTKAASVIVYVQGLSSPIKLLQAIGRGTRYSESHKDCVVFDFRVNDNGVLERHVRSRVGVYKEITDNITTLGENNEQSS